MMFSRLKKFLSVPVHNDLLHSITPYSVHFYQCQSIAMFRVDEHCNYVNRSLFGVLITKDRQETRSIAIAYICFQNNSTRHSN